LATKKILLIKLGGGGERATSWMAPFKRTAATSSSIMGLNLLWDGVEKLAPGKERGRGDVK
jgi:hypothetical protein